MDCAGHFKLCFSIKAGDVKAPAASDCTIVTVCTEANYIDVGRPQAFPALPGWLATSPAQTTCAKKFAAEGGYGEMQVDGLALSCDRVGRVFHRMGYCPLSCGSTSSDPQCKTCQAGTSGEF